jgi:hypothetical protein
MIPKPTLHCMLKLPSPKLTSKYWPKRSPARRHHNFVITLPSKHKLSPNAQLLPSAALSNSPLTITYQSLYLNISLPYQKHEPELHRDVSDCNVTISVVPLTVPAKPSSLSLSLSLSFAPLVLKWPCNDSALVAGAQVWTQVSPCEICGGQGTTGTAPPPKDFSFPLSVSFHQCSILIHTSTTNAV